MGLFGKKPKGIDTGMLQAILQQGLEKQKGTIEEGYSKLPALTQKFEDTSGRLGEEFQTGAMNRAQQYAQGLQQVESPDLVRQQQAKAQELAFRNLPAAQQAIKENLAATGGLQRGAAIRALQAPVLQASQQASDMGFQIQEQAQLRNIARKEQALDTIFETGQGAALQKLGIDRGTASVLLNTGREDILNRAMALADIEAQRTQGLLEIEQLRQTQNITREQAKRAQRGALIGGLGSLAGAGLGMMVPGGGLAGAAIGSQLGAFAGSGATPDLSSALWNAYALQQAKTNPSQKTASFGGKTGNMRAFPVAPENYKRGN